MSASIRIDPSLCALVGGSGRRRLPTVSGRILPALLRSPTSPSGVGAATAIRTCLAGA
ncbi:MAG: hypothetical protein LBI92_04000 [Azoarcus sp.]|nr:hypothetical protein [Azoarcus sp.]